MVGVAESEHTHHAHQRVNKHALHTHRRIQTHELDCIRILSVVYNVYVCCSGRAQHGTVRHLSRASSILCTRYFILDTWYIQASQSRLEYASYFILYTWCSQASLSRLEDWVDEERRGAQSTMYKV